LLTNERMRVAVHRQRNCRMPGQRLRHLGMDAAVGQIRDERMPQAVEVGHKASTVGEAGRLPVCLKHGRRFLAIRGKSEGWGSRGQRRQEGGPGVGQLAAKGQRVFTPPLAVRGRNRDCRAVSCQLERTSCQAPQLTGSQAGLHCQTMLRDDRAGKSDALVLPASACPAPSH
jgi:hypothetical protein